MLFPLNQSQHPVLQRQLDADQARWSRLVQLETDEQFNAEELEAFRMKGLFGELPGSTSEPVTIRASGA